MSFLPYGGGRGGWLGAISVSGVLHGALAAGLLGVYGPFLVPPEPDASPTAFLVTLEQLDDASLAGTTDAAAAEGEEADPGDAPETPDDLVAETPDGIEAETAESATAETPEPAEAEALTAAPAEEALPLVEPEAVAGETVTAVPVANDDPDLSPIVPEAVAAPQSLAPVAPESGVLTPDAPVAQTVLALNAVPEPQPPSAGGTPQPAAARPPPSAQDQAIGALVERIRAATRTGLSELGGGVEIPPCQVALPRRDGAEGVGLAMISADEALMEDFAQRALTAEDAAIRQTRTLIDPRQCPVLDYVRLNRDYPATGIGLRVDTPVVESGGRLTGVLRGVAGRHVTLLLIDDNGVVQDLQRFLAFSGNLTRFDVPVTRAGPSRDTSQLLLAIATRQPPDSIRARIGRLAEEVFADLGGEPYANAALALATFDVR
ncbi:MAG: serine/threonine protein kinase [Rhodobacteraceae bacterium]|jgi:hypothetical protein|nr:serine/threonine protein kinase [Paracoccaceae bacterium]